MDRPLIPFAHRWFNEGKLKASNSIGRDRVTRLIPAIGSRLLDDPSLLSFRDGKAVPYISSLVRLTLQDPLLCLRKENELEILLIWSENRWNRIRAYLDEIGIGNKIERNWRIVYEWKVWGTEECFLERGGRGGGLVEIFSNDRGKSFYKPMQNGTLASTATYYACKWISFLRQWTLFSNR